jgi:signal transduction histidine kinase
MGFLKLVDVVRDYNFTRLSPISFTYFWRRYWIYKDNIIGALQILTLMKKRDFTSNEIETLMGLTDLAAQTIVNAQLYSEVNAGQEHLRRLSRQLVELQESERSQLARELHDEIGQYLTGLNYTLETIARSTPEKVLSGVERAQSITNLILNQVRDMSLSLHPAILDDFGLLTTFSWFFENCAKITHVQIRFEHSGIEKRRFDSSIELAVFRIIQEAITNIVRYAQVQEAYVTLQFNEGQIYIKIVDEGVGFDMDEALLKKTSIGIFNMRGRVALLNGEFMIESSKGHGTKILVRLPVRMKK